MAITSVITHAKISRNVGTCGECHSSLKDAKEVSLLQAAVTDS